MSKSVRTAVIAVVSVMLIGAMIAGIWLFANGQTANTTMQAGREEANLVKSGDHYIYADSTVKTATGEFVYKVYCDNCSGSGNVSATERCIAGCDHIVPYRLSGFMIDCEKCNATGVCNTCKGKGYTVGGWFNTHYGCADCGGSGEDGWLGPKYVEGTGKCSDCHGTKKVYSVCKTCDGVKYITHDVDCNVCSGKGYYWMSGANVIDCVDCHGEGKHLVTKSEVCSKCAGEGTVAVNCETCNATGFERKYSNEKCGGCLGVGKIGVGNQLYTCTQCFGTGKKLIYSGTCRVCHGQKVEYRECEKTQTVSIMESCTSCAGLGWSK